MYVFYHQWHLAVKNITINFYVKLQESVFIAMFFLSFAYLAPRGCDHKVSVHILVAELLANVQAQWAVVVVDVALGGIAEDGVRAIHLLELVGGVRIVGILVRVELERQPAVGFLYVVAGGGFRQREDFIEGIPLRPKK